MAARHEHEKESGTPPSSAYIVNGAVAGTIADAPVLLENYVAPKMENYVAPKRTWKSYVWSTLDVSKEEAIFLTKLDITLISSAALGVMIRYLDQVNITNAFTVKFHDFTLYAYTLTSHALIDSGMKEDLGLYGKELNYANALWGAAYVFGQIPSNLILTRVNTPRYIAFLELAYNVTGKPKVFSVAEINIIPLGINFVTIVGSLASSWISDALPGSLRWTSMVLASVLGIIVPAALGATPVHPENRGIRWALFYLMALSGTAAGVTWTYVNETSRHDPEKRAYVGAVMNALAFIFISWILIFTLPASKQPYVQSGMYAASGFAAAALLFAIAIGYMDHRDKERAAREKEERRESEEAKSVVRVVA
ncbi:hypothetical protein IAT38_003165 [Cryptococcus sp. DSM 104549]